MSSAELFAGKSVRVNVRYINDIEPLEGRVVDAGALGLVLRSGTKSQVRLIPWTSVVTVLVLEEAEQEVSLY
jgi:hypothetical protein